MKFRDFIAAMGIGLASLLAGCDNPQSMFHTAGPAAQRLAHLSAFIFILFGVVAVITIGILLAAGLSHRGTLDWHAPWNASGGHKFVLYGGLVIPGIILFVVFVLSLQRMTLFPLHRKQPMSPNILVIGHQWWWEVRYLRGPADQRFTTANEIHIPVGRPVEIALQSADVIHSFWVPALHGKVEMIPGLTNYLRVEASRAGNFKGQCAEYCGAQHAHMRLLVVAQPPAAYQAWRNLQLQPAQTPASPQAMQGREIFLHAACPLCHTIRGLGAAEGKAGPDLTHLAGRQYIGANSFPNDKADLAGWVTHAQSLKPGCKMPNLDDFTGPQLRALVAFLDGLK